MHVIKWENDKYFFKTKMEGTSLEMYIKIFLPGGETPKSQIKHSYYKDSKHKDLKIQVLKRLPN